MKLHDLFRRNKENSGIRNLWLNFYGSIASQQGVWSQSLVENLMCRKVVMSQSLVEK